MNRKNFIQGGLLKTPRLQYCYFADFLEDDKVLLLSEKDNTLITGKLHSEILRHIREDGISAENLISQLKRKYSIFDIITALQVLEKEGYITESTSSLPPEVSAYWNSVGIHPDALRETLEDKPVSVEFLGELRRDVFLQAFNSIGIKTSTKGVLRVIITNDYERTGFQQINREAMETKQPWLIVKPYGVELWIGPVFLPGQTGCWECLRQRLKNNRPMITFYRNRRNTEELPPIPAASLPVTSQIAVNLTALEIVKWLYFGHNERLEGKIVTFDTRSLASRSHMLVKRPQCSVCGENAQEGEKPPGPIILQKKTGRSVAVQGGYREVPLENTIEKYSHHISPVTGVIQTLKPYYPNKDAPIYNYYSGINVALQSKSIFWMNAHIRGVNGGKGTTVIQAKAGALCEAIERYCSTYQGDEYHITESLLGLGSDAVHPNTCMNFSDAQYRHRDETYKKCSKFYTLTPIPFDESLKMHWTPVYSLTEHKFKYLPSCFCYAQYPAEDEANLFAYPDTNGCAAGNSLEEAILQGFLELVERDSVALWWYNMTRRPEVDLLSFNEPYFVQLIDYYKSLNRSLYVLDLTADMQIPAFGAISHRLDEKKSEIVFGFGAHVDVKIAVERALVELNQILPIVQVPETNRAKGEYRIKDEIFRHWLNTATTGNQPYLVPDENTPVKKALDYPPLCAPNIYDSLMFCIDAAESRGLETLVLDLTRPDIGLNVVKVVIPEMRHFWKRLAPGRLYDVPVKMGWLDAPLKEDELNPLGLFI